MENPVYEIKLEHTDQPPVKRTDDHEDPSDPVNHAHVSLHHTNEKELIIKPTYLSIREINKKLSTPHKVQYAILLFISY